MFLFIDPLPLRRHDNPPYRHGFNYRSHGRWDKPVMSKTINPRLATRLQNVPRRAYHLEPVRLWDLRRLVHKCRKPRQDHNSDITTCRHPNALDYQTGTVDADVESAAAAGPEDRCPVHDGHRSPLYASCSVDWSLTAVDGGHPGHYYRSCGSEYH